MKPPVAADPFARLKALTSARVALGRSGPGLPTAAMLEFQRDHALARDAVHAPFEPERIAAALAPLPCTNVRSQAGDRGDYLRRPDLGRRLDPASVEALRAGNFDLVIVVGDGLSAPAAHAHAAAIVTRLIAALDGWSITPVVIASLARVALADDIGERLGARISLILLGERPGLSAPDSLGAYLTWNPRAGRLDSERNCVSNIRPPEGLGYDQAVATLTWLLRAARARGNTGVGLKDESGTIGYGLAAEQGRGDILGYSQTGLLPSAR